MKVRFVFFWIGVALILAACSRSSADTEQPQGTSLPGTLRAVVTLTERPPLPSPTRSAESTDRELTPQPATAEPTQTPATTETPRPTPSPGVAHVGLPWADFSLSFDPTQWQIVAFDRQPELETLAHRALPGCRITPNIPVGLGEGWTIEKEQRTFGDLTLGVARFWHQAQLQFVVYTGFMGNLNDGSVEVHFDQDAESCLEAAETLFAASEVIAPTPQS